MPAPSLRSMAERCAVRNIVRIDDFGDIPYDCIEPIIKHIDTAAHLRALEEKCQQIAEESGPIWRSLIIRDIAHSKDNIKPPRNPDNWHKVYRKMKNQDDARKVQAEKDLMNDMLAAQASKKTIEFAREVLYAPPEPGTAREGRSVFAKEKPGPLAAIRKSVMKRPTNQKTFQQKQVAGRIPSPEDQINATRQVFARDKARRDAARGIRPPPGDPAVLAERKRKEKEAEEKKAEEKRQLWKKQSMERHRRITVPSVYELRKMRKAKAAGHTPTPPPASPETWAGPQDIKPTTENAPKADVFEFKMARGVTPIKSPSPNWKMRHYGTPDPNASPEQRAMRDSISSTSSPLARNVMGQASVSPAPDLPPPVNAVPVPQVSTRPGSKLGASARTFSEPEPKPDFSDTLVKNESEGRSEPKVTMLTTPSTSSPAPLQSQQVQQLLRKRKRAVDPFMPAKKYGRV